MVGLQITIPKLKEALRKFEPAVVGQPLKIFWRKTAIVVQSAARQKAPVDTGRLRSSIAYEIDSAEVPLWAKIGTNVKYAKPMEFGTGALSEAPDSSHRAHFPPPGALDVWARRHGFSSGFAVSQIIGRRGGLRPRRFLRGGLEQSVGAIKDLLNVLGEDIRKLWEHK